MPTTCAVLGQQTARPGAGPGLAALNTELGEALDVPGLLRFQVLSHTRDDTRLCVYWLWRDIRDRDAVWAAPPPELTGFWDEARPLWAADPSVRRLHWQPAADRDLCPPSAAVVLTELPADSALAGPADPGDAWLRDADTGAVVRCHPASGPDDPDSWRALWQRRVAS